MASKVRSETRQLVTAAPRTARCHVDTGTPGSTCLPSPPAQRKLRHPARSDGGDPLCPRQPRSSHAFAVKSPPISVQTHESPKFATSARRFPRQPRLCCLHEPSRAVTSHAADRQNPPESRRAVAAFLPFLKPAEAPDNQDAQGSPKFWPPSADSRRKRNAGMRAQPTEIEL